MNVLAHLYTYAIQHPYDSLWNLVGFGGQGIFTVRMLLQWLKSEQEGHSVVPLAFWYCSFLGGFTLFIYEIHLQAWPLVLGQGFPLPIYARNIWMMIRDQRRASSARA